jgi:hypothetical protein
MFESHHQPLLSAAAFVRRMMVHFGAAFGIIAFGLGIGVLGYHYLGPLGWVDSILNAAMILGGMGPVNSLDTNAAKLFAAGYALFSGVIFLVAVATLFSPVVHRVAHRFHLDATSEGGDIS